LEVEAGVLGWTKSILLVVVVVVEVRWGEKFLGKIEGDEARLRVPSQQHPRSRRIFCLVFSILL
jgi:hypothetical protein